MPERVTTSAASEGRCGNWRRTEITEVYPSIFKSRYPRDDRTADEQDAYATARWPRGRPRTEAMWT